MQEVALAAVRQKTPLSDATKVAPWLYRIAVRQSLLYRRSAGRRRKLTDRYTERFRPKDVNVELCDPLDWLVADERHQLVREALDELAPRDAELLLLKYTQGWSYREIARHLGVSHSAVEARLHRARARLRKVLATFSITEVDLIAVKT